MSHRTILERTYIATAKIYIFEKLKEKGITKPVKKLWKDNFKCRIDYETITGTEQGNFGQTYQQITLFCSPDIIIPANSEIEITQLGVTEIYKNSGKAARYTTHQEIILLQTEVA